MTDFPESDDPLKALAHQLVDEAMASLPRVLSREEEMLVRTRMLCDLLANPEGRLRLRRCLEDPAVDSSQEQQGSSPHKHAMEGEGDEEEPHRGKEKGNTG